MARKNEQPVDLCMAAESEFQAANPGPKCADATMEIVRLCEFENGSQGSVVFVGDVSMPVIKVGVPTLMPTGACTNRMYTRHTVYLIKLQDGWYDCRYDEDSRSEPKFSCHLPAKHKALDGFRYSSAQRFVVFDGDAYMLPGTLVRSIREEIAQFIRPRR